MKLFPAPERWLVVENVAYLTEEDGGLVVAWLVGEGVGYRTGVTLEEWVARTGSEVVLSTTPRQSPWRGI